MSKLGPAIDQLESMGQIDQQLASQFKQSTNEMNRQAASLKSIAVNTGTAKKGLDDVAKSTKSITSSFMQGFKEGIIDALADAGVSTDKFAKAMEKAGVKAPPAVVSIRQELKALTEEILKAKVNGEDFGKAYEALVDRAAKLKDALGDVGQEVKVQAANSKVLDGLLSVTQGVASGFAVAQGTQALFGQGGKELQEVLLKVNSSMAILQGFQGIVNLLQKESAASLLLLNIQKKISTAQTVLDTAAESKNIIVKVAATVAQKALNAAMAANPIGVVAVALAGLIALVANYTENTREAAAATASLNAALDSSGKQLDAQIEGIKNVNSKILADMKARGALESEIQAQTLEGERQVNQARVDELDKLYIARDNARNADAEKQKEIGERILEIEGQINKANIDGLIARTELERTQREESLKSFAGSIDAQLAKAKEGSARQLALRKQQISAQTALELNAAGLTEGEKAAIIAKGQQAQLELEAEFNKRKIDVQIKNIEAQLVNVKEGSDEEYKLRQSLLNRQMESELTNTKLSEAEKNVIVKNYLAQRQKLYTDFLRNTAIQTLQNQSSLNSAEIAQLNISNQDKLNLTIANLENQADIEVQNANGNAAKIKQIYAERDAAIRDTKKQFILDAVNYEIELEAAKEGANRRGLEKIVANERKSYRDRIAAREQLTDIEISAIDKQLDGLEEQKRQKLISDKDYELQYQQLLDKRKEAEEKNIDDIAELRKASNEQIIQGLFMVADAIGQTFSLLADMANERAQARIDQMQMELDAAVEAGAITEKEEISRQKRIDAEQRRAKREQAIREKNMAMFEATLAIPKAFLQGLTSAPPPLGPILGGLMAGLATIRAIAISAAPLPKFGKGKTKSNKYEGLAEIGETGSEIHEINGRMYLVNKPTITWVGRDDVVYNPKQTQEMLSHKMPTVENEMVIGKPTASGDKIDYKKLEKIYAKANKGVSIHIDKDFIKESVADGLSVNNYFDNRYRSDF